LRRDQAKGFDRLEPEGFYDTIDAYGLPRQIIEFDRAAQTDVPYRVKTCYGLSDAFLLTGVTKQRGPLSLLKSTMRSSMANHWLVDSFRSFNDSLTIMSLNHLALHTPVDTLILPLQMVEAMDDSLIPTSSIQALHRTTHMMEFFQTAYSSETNWEKSMIFTRNVPNLPPSILITSVLFTDPSCNVQ
jgi:hypothetical protein